MINELLERELQNTSINDVSLADYVKENYVSRSVLEQIRDEIKAIFSASGDWMYDEGYEYEHTVCEVLIDVLQIIDKYREEMEGNNGIQHEIMD